MPGMRVNPPPRDPPVASEGDQLWFEASDEPDAHDPELPAEDQLRAWLGAALDFLRRHQPAPPLALDERPVELSVRWVGLAEGRQLNHEYRDKDKATNVLSFPSDLPDWLRAELPEQPLGDLVICLPVLRQEAALQHKTFAQHLHHLLLHGLLHVVGYDHIDPQDADLMEALEVTLLAAAGDPNPYLLIETEDDTP